MEVSKTTSTSEDEDDDDESIEDKSKESLIDIINQQRSKLIDKELLIEDLKADLRREKKLNDMLINQAAYIRSLRHQVDSVLKGQSESSKDGDRDDEDCLPPSQPITPFQQPSGDSPKSPILTAAQRTPVSDAVSRSQPLESSKSANPWDDDGDDMLRNNAQSNAGLPDDTERSNVETNRPPSTPNHVKQTLETAELHEADVSRSKKLSYILNSFKNIPHHRNIAVIGDSNLHGVKETEIDSQSKQIVVRGCSGLCVPAAVYALKQYNHKYSHFKRIIWSLGTNDLLHKDQHCPDDWQFHLDSLFKETKRVFPRAKIGFVMPFHGLPSVPQSYIKFISDSVKNASPTVKRYTTPTMKNKVKGDGVHITAEGAHVFESYIKKIFVGHHQAPNQVQQPVIPKQNESPRSPGQEQNCNLDPHPVHQNVNLSGHIGGYGGNQYFYPPPPIPMQCFRPQFPAVPNFPGHMIRDISEAVAAAVWSGQHAGGATSQRNAY